MFQRLHSVVILKEFPFRVTYVGEKASDTGGVSRIHMLFTGTLLGTYMHCDNFYSV